MSVGVAAAFGALVSGVVPLRVVVLGVELGELLFEAADALVLVADRADAAEELGVVVGRATGRTAARARTRPTTSQRMPPSTGSRTTMSTHTGLLTPRCRVGGCTAQSTMVKTQKAASHQGQMSSTRTTSPS